MGNLVGRKIIQSRIWLDPDLSVIPPYDYEYSYPKTVYEAINQTMDDNSPTLKDELQSIYRLINDKQDIIDSGIAGNVMLWSGVRGQIGTAEIVRVINTDPSKRSNTKLVSERAIGAALDAKVATSVFNSHVYDSSMHTSDVERNRWNQMAPLSTLNAHMMNSGMHVTETQKAKWDAKADGTMVDEHIYNINNPHNVTAHQAGAYTQREIDEMFEKLRSSFFNYLNIYWDDRNNQGKLIEYNAAQWNPNFVLEYNETLPNVEDPSLIYFAVRPATDYQISETADCIIYIKQPGLTWTEIGIQQMNPGDLLISFPDTTMYVWLQGRFKKLFIGESNEVVVGGDGKSDQLWKPVYDEETGVLTWVQVKASESAPPPMKIKGEDGYTPIKGIDYDDGKDGQGVAIGGKAGSILAKLTDENYDTTWTTLIELLNNLVVAGQVLPDGLVDWDTIKNRPEWYNELGDNDDGFITQKAATKQFEEVSNLISKLTERMDSEGSNSQDIYDHVNDYNNPHRVTPAIIGAVSNQTFLDHVQNRENPHGLTAADIHLGHVDDTPDIEKPISLATQAALDEINKKLALINGDVDEANYIANVTWNDTNASLVFIFKDDTELEVRIPIPDIFQNIYFDNATKELVIVLPDGNENRINISDLIQVYVGSISANIQVIVESDNTIKATIVPSSVGELEIAPSVHLRANPTTTTQPENDRSTRIATTEFVKSIVIDNLISYETDRPGSANMLRLLNQRKVDHEQLIQILNDMEGLEVIDTLESTSTVSPLSANMGRYIEETKAPTVHTSPSGSTYGRATVSLFGHARASDQDPEMDGTVFRGIDNGYFAREGHRHPTDITRAPLHWPDEEHNQVKMTGEPKADTPPDNSNDERIATTEWIRRNAVGTSFGKCATPTDELIKNVILESTYLDDPVLMLQKGSSVCVLFAFDAIPAGVDKASNKVGNDYLLDVHGTGAKPIRYASEILRSEMIKAGYTYTFTFDGAYWQLQNPSAIKTLPDDDYSNSLVSSEWVRRNAIGVSYGVCKTAGKEQIKVCTLQSTFCSEVAFMKQKGTCIAITFENEDTTKYINTTSLDVNGTGASQVRFAGNPVPTGYIGSKYCHMFVYDGIYWQLINPATPGTKPPSITPSYNEEDPITTIEQHSGYMGYTSVHINTYGMPDERNVDSNGLTKTAIFNITYPDQLDDVAIVFNDENHDVGEMEDAWACMTGNGTKIMLRNPKCLSADKSSAIIEFDMDTAYPINAPIELIYNTNKAWIGIKFV